MWVIVTLDLSIAKDKGLEWNCADSFGGVGGRSPKPERKNLLLKGTYVSQRLKSKTFGKDDYGDCHRGQTPTQLGTFFLLLLDGGRGADVRGRLLVFWWELGLGFWWRKGRRGAVDG